MIGTVGIVRALLVTSLIAIVFSYVQVIQVETILAIMNFIEPEVVPIVTTFANIKTINGDPINIYVYAILAIAVIVLFLCLLTNGLLILGAVRKCRYLLIPFLVLEPVMIIISCISLGLAEYKVSNTGYALIITRSIIVMAFSTYFIVIVGSYFQEISEEVRHPNKNYKMAHIVYQRAANPNRKTKNECNLM